MAEIEVWARFFFFSKVSDWSLRDGVNDDFCLTEQYCCSIFVVLFLTARKTNSSYYFIRTAKCGSKLWWFEGQSTRIRIIFSLLLVLFACLQWKMPFSEQMEIYRENLEQLINFAVQQRK